jgi:uncharacterized protein
VDGRPARPLASGRQRFVGRDAGVWSALDELRWPASRERERSVRSAAHRSGPEAWPRHRPLRSERSERSEGAAIVSSVGSSLGAATSAALLGLIASYKRWISPLLGPRCRFYPSCSTYAAACIEAHGSARGTLLSIIRVCKCHPLHPGGVDLPPPARQGLSQAHPFCDAGDAGDAPDLPRRHERNAPAFFLPPSCCVNRAADGPK